MKHTKNILKSLLITVMALSLLAVSCKKDEGGSKPTDPTPITLGVKELNAIVNLLVEQQTKWTIQNNPAFNPQNGKGSISVKVDKAFENVEALKNALTTLSSGGITISATANSTFGPTALNNKAAAKFDITIDIGSNNFASGLADSKEYNISGKKATLELTITPVASGKNWDFS